MIERLNPGYFHICGNEGAMDHNDMVRSIALPGKAAIPALREAECGPTSKSRTWRTRIHAGCNRTSRQAAFALGIYAGSGHRDHIGDLAA